MEIVVWSELVKTEFKLKLVKTSHFTSLKTKAKSKVPSTYKYGTQLSGSSSNKNTKWTNVQCGKIYSQSNKKLPESRKSSWISLPWNRFATRLVEEDFMKDDEDNNLYWIIV